MRRFHDNDRVRVLPTEDLAPSLHGLTGTVRRLRRCDDGAWVQMDTLPAEFRSFPISDERANHLLLYPELCEAATPAPVRRRPNGRRA